jgi:uncharacterized protein YlxW (UPF0749 family)
MVKLLDLSNAKNFFQKIWFLKRTTSHLSKQEVDKHSSGRLRNLEKQLQKKQDQLKSLLSDWRSRILKCSDMPPKISSAI